jgi:hypothetical protein
MLLIVCDESEYGSHRKVHAQLPVAHRIGRVEDFDGLLAAAVQSDHCRKHIGILSKETR